MTSELAPKSILESLNKLDDDVTESIADALEIGESGTLLEKRAQVVSVLNEDAEALARLLLKIDREIFDLVSEVVEKGRAKISIIDLFQHPVSADCVSFLTQFFPEDADKEGSDIRYFMPTDVGFGDNIRRLFADGVFLGKRKRTDGMRDFLKGVANFYGAVGRIDLNNVLAAIGGEVVHEFNLGAPVSASEFFDFARNGVLPHDFQLCVRNRPDGLGEYLMPVSAPENDEEERSLDGLLLSIIENRSGKPIKLPAIDDLQQLTFGAEYDYIETDESNDLFDFLTEELGYDEDLAIDLIGYTAIRVRIGADLQAVLKGLNEEFQFVMPSKSKLADESLALFCNYINSVPTWSNYGASPTETHKLLGSSGDIEIKSYPVPKSPGRSLDDADDDDTEEHRHRKGAAMHPDVRGAGKARRVDDTPHCR